METDYLKLRFKFAGKQPFHSIYMWKNFDPKILYIVSHIYTIVKLYQNMHDFIAFNPEFTQQIRRFTMWNTLLLCH